MAKEIYNVIKYRSILTLIIVSISELQYALEQYIDMKGTVSYKLKIPSPELLFNYDNIIYM
jgi:hypothetical protein